MKKIVHVLHDLLFQQRQTLRHVELGDRLGFDLHQLASGGVDGVELLEQAPARRHVPEDAHHRGHGPLIIRDRGGGRGDELIVALAAREGELLASAAGDRLADLLRAVEQRDGPAAKLRELPADLLGVFEEAGIHPGHGAGGIDDPDPFPDVLQDRRRGLRREPVHPLADLIPRQDHQGGGLFHDQPFRTGRIIGFDDFEGRPQRFDQARLEGRIARQQNQAWAGQGHEVVVLSRSVKQLMEV